MLKKALRQPQTWMTAGALSLLSFSLYAQVDLPHVFQPNTVIKASEVNTDLAVLKAAIEQLQQQQASRLISVNTTINVAPTGGDFATVHEALASLAEKSISPNAIVTIKLADGVYGHTQPIVMNHPNGSQIQIIGNTADQAAVRLEFTDCIGVQVENAHALGGINGLTLRGGGSGPAQHGVLVGELSFASLGPALTIENFRRNGLYVRFGATAVAKSVVSQNNAAHGFAVEYSGSLWASGATALNNGSFGFAAAFSGSLVAVGAVARGNIDGYHIGNGGTANLDSAVAEANTGVGFWNEGNAVVTGATSKLNGNAGFLLADGGSAIAAGAKAIDNGQAGFTVLNGSVLDGVGAPMTSTGNAYGLYIERMSLAHLSGFVSCGNGDSAGGDDHFNVPAGVIGRAGEFIEDLNPGCRQDVCDAVCPGA
jgi:hypothetical protein